jgi:DNA mismatch endonuclease (patch repair protein)
MRANRKADTGPERRLRSEMHQLGLRYRVGVSLLAGAARVRPDVVFTRAAVVLFVDGCYWHSCPEHGTSPRSNAAYWLPKLARNVERDRDNDAALAAAGWRVVRVWEHEDPILTAVAVAELVKRRRMGSE